MLSSVQFSHSVMSDSLWPHGLQHTRLPCPSPTPSLLRLMPIELVMSSNHFILCHLLLLLPSIFPRIMVFSNESVPLISWPKYWSFSFSISPSNEYSGLISFRMDWVGVLAVQGTLKSLLQHHSLFIFYFFNFFIFIFQHHSLKASVLRCSAFFVAQLSHPYSHPYMNLASEGQKWNYSMWRSRWG